MCTLLDLCVSSLRRGHANLLCIVPILTDDPRRESDSRRAGGAGEPGDEPAGQPAARTACSPPGPRSRRPRLGVVPPSSRHSTHCCVPLFGRVYTSLQPREGTVAILAQGTNRGDALHAALLLCRVKFGAGPWCSAISVAPAV